MLKAKYSKDDCINPNRKDMGEPLHIDLKRDIKSLNEKFLDLRKINLKLQKERNYERKKVKKLLKELRVLDPTKLITEGRYK